jgi:hypothetical protein
MGETELEDVATFEGEIETIDNEWFLGSEEYLWNAAIERNMAQMERLIM